MSSLFLSLLLALSFLLQVSQSGGQVQEAKKPRCVKTVLAAVRLWRDYMTQQRAWVVLDKKGEVFVRVGEDDPKLFYRINVGNSVYDIDANDAVPCACTPPRPAKKKVAQKKSIRECRVEWRSPTGLTGVEGLTEVSARDWASWANAHYPDIRHWVKCK